MKKLSKIFICILLLFSVSTIACEKEEVDSKTSTNTSNTSSGDTPCGYHNGKQLYKGPQGGCYYINSNGNKTYVNRSECNC